MAGFGIVFISKNYDEAIHFYRDLLKFTVDHSWDNGAGNRGSVFCVGNGTIEILALKPDAEHKPPMNFEVYMEVENVDQFYFHVKSLGIPIRGEIADKPWGQRTFSLTDPDGIKLVFYTVI
ncbi:MAG: VOC family protein [Anaerolineaceae bacterium]